MNTQTTISKRKILAKSKKPNNQTCGHSGGRGEWDEMREWHEMYTSPYVQQPASEVCCMMQELKPGVL